MASHADIDEITEFEEVTLDSASAAASLPTFNGAAPDSPLDDTKQLDDAIAQRRARIATLQTERQAHESQLAQIAAQQKMLAQRHMELQHALKRNDSQRMSTATDLDNLMQTKTRLQSLQQQAALAAAQSRAAMQQRAALSATLRPLMPAQPGPPPPAPAGAPPPAAPMTAAASAVAVATAHVPAAAATAIQAQLPPNVGVASAVAPPPQAAATPMLPSATPLVAAAPAALPPRGGPPPINRAPRLPLAVEVDFTSETNLFVGFSEDISEGGLFVATEQPAAIGTNIAVAFTLPHQRDPIRCETKVAWSVAPSAERPDQVPGMGLKFLDLSDTDRERLRAFISMREPLFFPG